MEYGKELLKSRIAQIHDPVQKRLLQDVLVDVFGELLAYSEESFQNLEHKIDNERCDPDAHYAVYTGVCKRDGLDSASRSLFEMEIQSEQERVPGYLGTLFFACDHLQIRSCMAGTYHVRVETDLGEYETTASLSYCRDYLEAVSRLHQQFMANKRRWHTINCPYIYKFLDITDREGVVPWDAVISKVEIDLGELSGIVMDDIVPVWNITEEICKPKVEVAVAGNVSYYAHHIPLEDLDAGALAVPEGEDLFSVVFSQDEMLVRTENEAHHQLKLVRLRPMHSQKDQTALEYSLQTNRRILRHADRQALGQPRYLWTKGEVERMLGAYEVFSEFELEDIRPDMRGEVEVLDMNPFLRVHSFLPQKRKIALILHAKNSSDIFRYEKMFFLLAELQLCTEEYEWIGIMR